MTMKTILIAAALAAATLGLSAAPALAQKPGAPDFYVSAKEREAQRAWWAERAGRKAERAAAKADTHAKTMDDCDRARHAAGKSDCACRDKGPREG